MSESAERVDPVDREYRRMAVRRWLFAGVVLYLLGIWIYWGVIAEVPVEYKEDEDHFLYGSIGADSNGGIPFEIWKILPEMFPEYLPDPKGFAALEASSRNGLAGYRQFGFIVEEGRDTPIGFSLRRDLVTRIGLNCSVCHTGSVVESPDLIADQIYEDSTTRTVEVARFSAAAKGAEGERDDATVRKHIIPGMPSNTVDLQAYFQFLFRCVNDGRFTDRAVMAWVNRNADLGPIARLIYRQAVPELRSLLLLRQQQLSYFSRIDSFGPGRIDTFGPYKTMVFGFPFDGTIGTSDFPSLWNQGPRTGMQLHWDGNNTSVFERNISASLGAGATPISLDMTRMLRVTHWIGSPLPELAPDDAPGTAEWDRPKSEHFEFKTIEVPKYPFAIDRELAGPGGVLYERHCASCHAFDGEQVGQVVPIDEIGTDRHRWESYTQELSVNQNTLGTGQWWRFRNFRRTAGYANHPLDGIWARGPYLHNGSVPTLYDLLNSTEKRPKSFFRGDDQFDSARVGFESHADTPRDSTPRAADGRTLFYYDTARPGNGNAGHEYGADLTPDQKAALLEYLKTL